MSASRKFMKRLLAHFQQVASSKVGGLVYVEAADGFKPDGDKLLTHEALRFSDSDMPNIEYHLPGKKVSAALAFMPNKTQEAAAFVRYCNDHPERFGCTATYD